MNARCVGYPTRAAAGTPAPAALFKQKLHYENFDLRLTPSRNWWKPRCVIQPRPPRYLFRTILDWHRRSIVGLASGAAKKRPVPKLKTTRSRRSLPPEHQQKTLRPN
jgi:hypothetical protein